MSIAWIRTIGVAEASGLLRELYDEERHPHTKGVDNILKVHSLNPESLRDHVRLYHTTLHGPSGLSRAEREMIGVVVSSLNGCHY